MAVSRYRTIQSGITTPESIPSTPMSSSFDEESVCDIYFLYKRKKKNLLSFSHSGINVVHLIIFPLVDGSHQLHDNNR